MTMNGGIRVGLLGPVRVMVGADHVTVGSERLRRLLTALAVDPGTVVSADRLVERVWFDADQPADPRRALRTYVARLRQALGSTESIVTEPGGWRLDLDRVEVDIVRFEDLLRSADDPTADTYQRLQVLDEALALWRGPAFEDFTYAEWVRIPAERLDELRLVAQERAFEARVQAGMHTDALPELTALVEANPLRDRLVGLRMLALFRSGRQAEALRAFQTHRDRLIEELGLEPGRDLTELERRIAEGDESLFLSGSAPGRALRGYRLGEQLGQGAFAVVYRGTQPSVGRDVAVKIIRAELANQPEFVRRFEAEAHLVARLEHPHIVPLYDYWREPSRACLVFRYLRGGTLEARLTGSGVLSPDEALGLVDQVGSALAAAHRAGVVHRDVKPANVLCDEEGHFYLGDFGIALEAAELSDPTVALSAGSPAYASPEQLRREAIGPSADVHGLGITLYEALTGRLPFPAARSQAELLQHQLNDAIPRVTERRPELPSTVDEVVARATTKRPEDRYQSIDELVAEFRAALDGAGAQGLPTSGRAGVATAVSMAGVTNPYRGLRAFDEADATQFFGRERLVERLLGVLDRTGPEGRIAAVVGPSGIGKSSVVRAGLLPALRDGAIPGSGDWFVATMLPGSDPFQELASALLRVATSVPDNMMSQLTEDTRGIARVVKAITPADGEVLVVVDQFEELFTLVDDDAEVRRFLAALEHAVGDARCPLRVVLTMRADFWDRPLQHGSFARLIEHSTVAVTGLAPDELERAITEPAHGTGAEFEPGLVSEIAADVADQPGGLPLLQYALTELWERRVSGLLTRDAYRELGGVSGALARRAEELYNETSNEEQPAIRRIFRRLVTPGRGTEDTRRRALRSEVVTDAEAEAVIDRYGKSRLLSFDTDPVTREPTVEVAHEALIREWPRLREWLDDDRDDIHLHRHLSAAAGGWMASGRDAGELYRGGRLEAAGEYVDRHPEALAGFEREFVDASLAQRRAEEDAEAARFEQQQRANRRLRGLLAAVACVAALAVIAGGLAFQQRARADDRAAEADRQADLAAEQADRALASEQQAEQVAAAANVRAIGAEAARIAPTNRRLAILLASEAYRRDPSVETQGYLQQVLSLADGFLGYLGTGTAYTEVEWLDDSTFLALTGDAMEVWDADEGAIVERVEAPGATTIADPGNGRWLAVLGDDLRIIDLDALEVDTAIELVDAPTAVLALDDPELVLVRFPDGVTAAWTTDGEPLWDRLVRPETLYGDHVYPPEVFSGQEPIIVEFWATVPLAPYDFAAVITSDEVVVNSGGFLRYLDPATGEPTRPELLVTFESPNGGLRPLAAEDVTPGRAGRVEAVLITRSSVTTLDLDTGATTPPRAVQSVFNQGIFDVDPGGVMLVRDGTVQDGEATLFDTQLGSVNRIDRSPDSSRYVVASDEGLAVFSADGRQLIAGAVPRAGVGEVSATADGEFLIHAGFGRGTESIGQFYRRNDRGDYEPVEYASRLPDGEFSGGSAIRDAGGRRWLIAPRLDSEVDVIDLDTDKVLPIQPRANPVVELSHDGRWILSVNGSTTFVPGILVYEADTGDLVLDTTVDARRVVSGSFAPDSSRFTIVSEDGTVQHFSTDDWSRTVDDRTDIRFLAYSPYENVAATSDADGAILMRNAETLEPISPPMIGHQSQIGDLGRGFFFGEDGHLLVSAATDGARVWDLATWTEIGDGFPSPNLVLAGGADGGPSLFTSVGEEVLIWNLDFDSWPEIACRAAGRNLTRQEWDRFAPPGEPYQVTCPQWPAGN